MKYLMIALFVLTLGACSAGIDSGGVHGQVGNDHSQDYHRY